MLSRFAGNEEQSVAGLRGYWDSVINGDATAADQSRLDLEMAATVQQIHRQDDAITADPAFATRLLDQIISNSATQKTSTTVTFAAPRERPAHEGSPATQATKRTAARAGARRLWAVASAGSVVLLLIAIVAGTFIWNSNRQPVPAIIPLHSETTSSGVMIQTILEEHVAADTLPGNPTKWIATFKFSLEPGEAWRDRPSPCELSRQKVIGLVESGTLAMINTGPFEVTRSDGARESIQVGERVDLHAGDSWVYLSDRTETNVQKWNPETIPMVAYQTDWALDTSCETVPVNPEWLWHQSTIGAAFDPARPVVVTIEQAFVQPGATLNQDDAMAIGFVTDEMNIFRVIGVESGTLEEAWVPEALMQAEMPSMDEERQFTWKPGDAWTELTSLSPPEGQERAFRAGDEEPLVLTSFAWSYDDPGDAAGTTGGVTIETLVEQHVPVGVLRETTDNQIVNTKYSLEPGERWSDAPDPCEPARFFSIGYIESGVMALKSAGPFEAIRADGSSEIVPPGSEALLEHGDAWVYSSDGIDAFVEKWNPGTAPVLSIESSWELDSSCNGAPVNAKWLWGETKYPPQFDAARPVAVSIARAVVPPGATLSAEDVARLGLYRSDQDIFRSVAVASGALQLSWVPDAFSQAALAQPIEDFERVFDPGDVWTSDGSLTPPEGVEEEFSNLSDEPLVIEIVSWSYDDAADQSGGVPNDD